MWYPGKNIVQGVQKIGHGIMDRRRDNQAQRDRAMGDPGPAPVNSAAGYYPADRGAQSNALNAYDDVLNGGQPSMAQLQSNAGAAQNVTDQLGMMSMGSGGSLAAQSRQAMGAGSAGAMAANRDAAMLRAQELDAARAGYAGQANTMAGMTAGAMGQNADIAAQWGLGQRGMDLQAMQQRQQNTGQWADRIIGAGMGAAQIGMFSDERLKTDMRDATGEAGDTLALLGEVGYRYKDKRHGPDDKETIGIKAQDLQKTPGGRRVVVDVPGEGLAVDGPGSLSLLLAHGGDVERRLRKIEGRG